MIRSGSHRVVRPDGHPLAGVAARIEAGHETTSPGHPFPRRTIADLTVIWTEAGAATAEVNGVAVVHRPGTLLACAPGFALDERGDGTRPWTAAWLMLDGGWSEPLGRALAARPGGLLCSTPAPRRWLALARTAQSAALARPEGWEWTLAAVLAELLGALTAACGPAAAGRGLPARIAALVERAPERDWGLDNLARALGMSRSALAHRFPAEASTTVASFVRRRRCELAQGLLAAGVPVAETAERLGFANPFHFSRCYRAVMGAPPSRCRDESSRLR